MAGVAASLGAALLCLSAGHAATAELGGADSAGGRAAREPASSAATPFTLDHNRMIVEVELIRPDGTVRKARAWVDTGSENLTLSEPLARDLGFDVTGLKGGAPAVELAGPARPMRLGGLPLRVEGVRTRARSGPTVMPGVAAEANLPASLLVHDHVVFDYPARRITVARPGALTPRGVAIPCRVNPATGLLMIAAVLDGDTVQLGVDNGSAGTWVSAALTTKWISRHPEWPHATGAAGSANFFGFPFEPEGVLMRLPELRLGSVLVRDAGVLGLDQSLFDWYSKKSASPVRGFLGANVLRAFRLEVDFPNRMTYWERGAADEPGDLDVVGLTLRPEADGSVTVAGVVRTGDAPAVRGVQPGDRLIRVDRWDVVGATMGQVVNALRGPAGSTRTLVVERDGQRRTVEAKVLRLP
jgi:hypothetical protein